ncbi:hypothetical protein MNBD_ALPHA04-337 [hydrothermal vent metagenome]|uniref:Uncharacterized protein n=1 Tax=hydrothermal vent metagenome TaxID=652676 RepID=A0A3B0SE34_9ZZZZ
MASMNILNPHDDRKLETPEIGCTPAIGLFGYSITNGRPVTFESAAGYVRDIEQMPNFSPPEIDRFVAQYISSNIGTTQSSS